MNNKMLRANAEIQKELVKIIKTLKDLRISNEIISVLWVKTSKDFAHCKAGVSIYNEDENERKKIFNLLIKSSSYIKKTLANNLKLRAVPEIVFELDEGIFYEEKIKNIISSLNIPKENNGGKDNK